MTASFSPSATHFRVCVCVRRVWRGEIVTFLTLKWYLLIFIAVLGYLLIY